jgi:DNA primase
MNNLPSEEIKSKIDIVDVVSGYIKLTRTGSNFKAVCPFHNENSPSFFISPEKQIFNCFGCGKGGDMFKFVMEIEGVEFIDALRILAKKAGVVLKRENKEASSERSLLQDICVDAARYFVKNLNSDVGKNAMEYLKKRELKKETIEEFKLGYTLPSWDGLYNFLSLKGYKAEMMEKAGLVLSSMKSGRKKYFDRFRDRIMFPISDVNGYIVGFTGRYLTKKENEGKYVNSPQTPIFDKGSILYNLEKAKLQIKKENFTFLVEGQMDVIASWQDGVRNTVASSGTALTPNQIKLLKRYSNNIKIAFDADDAGDTATKRGIDVARTADMNISIIRVPDGKDPADFVLAHPKELKALAESSISVMDYHFESALSKYNPDILEDKKKIAAEILPHIKKTANKIEVYHWLDKLSQIIKSDIKYLEDELKKISIDTNFFYSKNVHANKEDEKKIEKDLDRIFGSLMSFLIKKQESFSVLKDLDFLEFLKENKEELSKLISKKTIDLFDFLVNRARMGQISEIIEKADEKQKEALNSIILQAEIMDEGIDIENEVSFCVNKIRSDFFKFKIDNINLKIKEAEREDDQEAVLKYLSELNNLITKK